jgi:hypothetical protein
MPVEPAVDPGVPQSPADEITISPAAAQPDYGPGCSEWESLHPQSPSQVEQRPLGLFPCHRDHHRAATRLHAVAQSGLYEPGLATEHLIQVLIISGS